MSKLKNLWPHAPCTEKYIADRRASDDAYMLAQGITATSHEERDYGLVNGNYVSEWVRYGE